MGVDATQKSLYFVVMKIHQLPGHFGLPCLLRSSNRDKNCIFDYVEEWGLR